MLNKIRTILLSRIKRNNSEEKWVEARRKICLGCEYNSLNVSSLNGYTFFLTTASRFYSWIMGRSKEDVYGNCTACEACSVYFKAFEKLETCKKNKWEILEDDSMNLNIRDFRKINDL